LIMRRLWNLWNWRDESQLRQRSPTIARLRHRDHRVCPKRWKIPHGPNCRRQCSNSLTKSRVSNFPYRLRFDCKHWICQILRDKEERKPISWIIN
jgi:hypothetical protein